MSTERPAHDRRPADPFTERTPRVVAAVKLHRSAARRERGQFLCEGAHAVGEALAAGAVRELFVTASAAAREADLLAAATAAGALVSPVTERAAAALSDTVTPQGLVAVCATVDAALDAVLDARPRLLAVPVDVGEPGNVGTVVRVADAAGADAVVLAGDCVDPHNGKAVRASTGSLFHLPVVRERATATVLAGLRRAGVQVLATAADGEAELWSAALDLRRPTAWLLGSEAHGLPADVAAAADARVRIPVHGRAESLNLAVAAGLCLYASAQAQRT
ncbi:TrmH family RNA methyltransferase [Rhodococcus aerolatus]